MKNRIFIELKKEELSFLFALVEGNINSFSKKSNLSKEEKFVYDNLLVLQKKLKSYEKLVVNN